MSALIYTANRSYGQDISEIHEESAHRSEFFLSSWEKKSEHTVSLNPQKDKNKFRIPELQGDTIFVLREWDGPPLSNENLRLKTRFTDDLTNLLLYPDGCHGDTMQW